MHSMKSTQQLPSLHKKNKAPLFLLQSKPPQTHQTKSIQYCLETIDKISCPCHYFLKPPICPQLQKLMTDLPETHKTTQVWEKVVVKCGMLLKIVPREKITEKMCNIAISTNARAFKHVPDDLKTKKMCVDAVSSKYCGLENLSSHVPRHLMREVCLEIVKNYAPLCLLMTKSATDVVLFEVSKEIISANQNEHSWKKIVCEHDCCLDTQRNMYIDENTCGEVCKIKK